MKYAAYFLSCCLLILIIFLIGEYFLSYYFNDCMAGSTIKSIAYLICSVSFADRHGEGITALASIVIAGLAWTLLVATLQQTRLTQENINLVREGFISTHRPKLVVRDVSIGHIYERQPISVRFTYINAGETVAHITEITAFVFSMLTGHQFPSGLPFASCEITKPSLLSGEFGNAESLSGPLGAADIEQLKKGETTLYIAGSVRYKDEKGVFRQTGFARYCYTSGEGAVFRRIDDNDEYEYSY